MTSVRPLPTEDLPDDLPELLEVPLGIRRQDGTRTVEGHIAPDPRVTSAGLLQDRQSRGVIPRRQADLEVQLPRALGDERQLERRRADPADVVDPRVQDLAHLEARPGQRLLVAAVRRAQHAVREAPVGYADRPPVLERPASDDRAVQRVGEGVQHEPRVRLRVPEQRHGYGAHRDPAGEVGRAVDRVDDPRPFGIVEGGLVPLLAYERRSRQEGCELGLQEPLVLHVGGRDQVLAGALDADCERMVLPDPAPGFPHDALDRSRIRLGCHAVPTSAVRFQDYASCRGFLISANWKSSAFGRSETDISIWYPIFPALK